MQTVDYKAIPRRFRPTKFSEVTGQEAVVQVLRNAVKEKRASHAYLFSGIRGTGKTTLARIFAKALNCPHTVEGEPCNVCSSCQEISSGQSLDVLEIDGASNRGIDDIRNLNETMGYATLQGRFKIIIIDEVHMLTKEAFNALLKNLEEPPANVKFFLATTEPQKVLPTIISRCQRFDLGRIPSFLIIKKLRTIAQEIGVSIEDEALSVIARLSEGSLRDAESIFDQLTCLGVPMITAEMVMQTLGLVAKSDFFALDEAFIQGDLGFPFTFSQKILQTGRDMTFFLEALLEHYRNIALLLLGKKEKGSDLLTEEEREGYERACKQYTLPQVLHILDYLSDLIHQAVRPTYKKIHIEMVLLHILQTKNRIFIETLLKKVASIEPQNAPPPAPPQELVKQEAPAPAPKTEVVSGPPPPPKASPSVRHDTLLRFAQVEFGGTLKKS